MVQEADKPQEDVKPPSVETNKPSGDETTETFLTLPEYEFFSELKARERHGELDKRVFALDKYAGAGELERRKHEELKEKHTALQDEHDKLIAVGEGGADVVAKAKELREKEAQLKDDRWALGLDLLAHLDEKEKVERMTKFMAGHEIANRHGIDFSALVALRPETPEQMENMAKTLAEEKAKAQATAPPQMHADSGGVGGGLDLEGKTAEQLLRIGVEKSKPKTSR